MRAALLEDAQYSCPYLAGKTTLMEHFLADSVDLDEHDTLLFHGYRHFGSYYFRPKCEVCRACVPVRIPLDTVRLHRSWRRLLRKTARLEFRIGNPPAVQEAFELYSLHKRRFDDKEKSSLEIFRESFFAPHPAANLLTVRDGEHLVAVAHFDETPLNLSAVYTYYDDQNFAWASPGKLAILKLLELAAQTRRAYLYLGFYVHNNRAMAYKADYTPFEYSPVSGSWIIPDRPYSELSFDPKESLLARRAAPVE